MRLYNPGVLRTLGYCEKTPGVLHTLGYQEETLSASLCGRNAAPPTLHFQLKGCVRQECRTS